MTDTNETYLGDGLYASFDGWHFCLRAPSEEGDRMVYLDQYVLKAFQEYTEQKLSEPE